MLDKHSNESLNVQKVQSTDISRKRKNKFSSNTKDIVSSSGDIDQTLEDLLCVFLAIPGGSFVLNQSLSEGKKNAKQVSTILSKLQQKAYNSLSKIESDLVTATTLLLNSVSPVDLKYSLISSFYTFSRKLIIREQRNNITHIPTNDPRKYTQDIFPSRPPGNECLFVIGPNGPLFSSFAAKSVLDTRPIDTENRAYVTQIVPNHSVPVKSTRTFANISPPSSQSNISTSKKRKLRNPTTRRIPSIKWLYYDNYSSYAPIKDMETAIFSENHFNAVWWRREKERICMEAEENEKKNTNQSDTNSSDILELDEKLILSYEPISISDDLKTFSMNSKEENDVNINEIGRLIQTLSQMQTSRMSRSQTEAPGELEEQLAFYIQQLLLKQIMAFNIQPRELLLKPMSLCMSFLVLGPSYAGTLPNVPFISSTDELRNKHGSYSDLNNYNKSENQNSSTSQRPPNIPIHLQSLLRTEPYRSFLSPLAGYNRRLINRPKKY
ncbi:hypothetical protein PMAC_000025 [Pneumocystis sp. 'macacae']|nr:hypothetical protein PMAC_000025 [Pneumocystis sp. 'macacae']